jgi:hypothetical protein
VIRGANIGFFILIPDALDRLMVLEVSNAHFQFRTERRSAASIVLHLMVHEIVESVYFFFSGWTAFEEEMVIQIEWQRDFRNRFRKVNPWHFPC